MNRSCLLPAVCLCLAAASVAAAREVTLNGHVFTLPDNLTIELVAGPPLVDRPITAAFDDEGRLYVGDSSGSNDKIDKQLAEKPHRIVRLEDTDGDGRFDRSVVFADKMMFPEGTMWLDGSLYVAAPPSIWKLTDTDGDGVADRREEWFKGNTLTGCANDLHGPYLGPDGWIYWCKGAFAKQTYEQVGKSLRVVKEGEKPEKTWSTRASHIFRCRPDGSGLEQVMTGGMDNPVDVVFTPGGERIFTTTFLQNPASGRRDGLIHAIYGGVYGKQHDVIDDHKRTGELMPVLTHLGPAAPCGLAIYESNVIREYRNNLFACQFNLRKVSRHVLEPEGASFKTQDHDFLVSSNLDFHPTDVFEDVDGSLLVVDTGGWYKLCCPTSQLHKPDVLGAIYRVRQRVGRRLADPRGLRLLWEKIAADELALRLLDSRTTVRDRARRELAKRGPEAVRAIEERPFVNEGPGRGGNERLDIWTLTRFDDPAARAAVRKFLSSKDETTRQAALHSVSLWRDREAVPELLEIWKGKSPHNRRAAAEALGRIGEPGAVPELLAGATASMDRALEHSLIYALLEIADTEGTAKGLESKNPAVRRVALIALDQMEGGGLEPEKMAALLSSPDAGLKETAAWIVSRHADWGGALAGYLGQRLAAKELPEADRLELQRQLTQFARNGAVQELLASAAGGGDYSAISRQIALRAMRESGLKEMPPSWVAVVVSIVGGNDADFAALAVAVARSLAAPKASHANLAAALQKLARRQEIAAGVRLEALAAVPGGLPSVDGELFDFLRAGLSAESAVVTRSAAAEVLSKAKLSAAQLTSLSDLLATVGPLEVDRLLAAFEQSTDEAIGLKVVSVLKDSPARAGLRPDAVRSRLAKYPASVQKGVLELSLLLNVDLANQQARLEELLSSIKGGDIRRGQAVFMRAKTACNVCHQFGYVGGNLGPDLTRIGGIRTERDLLEGIAFPSASFVRSYESVTVVTAEGKTVSGLLRKDSADEVILATSATETVRIPRADIEEMRPGAVSIMPSGLDQQLTVQELADLVAFLKAAK